jgi:hypothetical protein
VADSRFSGCSGFSGFCPNFLKSQKFSMTRGRLKMFCTNLAKLNFLGGPPNMFRVFRLLPKLSLDSKKCHVALSGCLGCSGCSGSCANFLKRQSFHDTWPFLDVQNVQGVQAFTQTSSRDKASMTRGSFGMFKMFRVVRLLRKLPQETKFPCHRMFRPFKLLRKLL